MKLFAKKKTQTEVARYDWVRLDLAGRSPIKIMELARQAGTALGIAVPSFTSQAEVENWIRSARQAIIQSVVERAKAEGTTVAMVTAARTTQVTPLAEPRKRPVRSRGRGDHNKIFDDMPRLAPGEDVGMRYLGHG